MDTLRDWSSALLLPTHQNRLNHFDPLLTVSCIVILVLLCWLIGSRVTSPPQALRVPIHGARWSLEPALLTKSRFVSNAKSIISSGCKKFPGQPFVVRRYDADITILPHRYLPELRLVPSEQLSSVHVQAKNMVHKYTNSTFLMTSDLHFRAVQDKIVPDMPFYIETAIEELDHGQTLGATIGHNWVDIDVQSSVRMLVARITSIIMIGSQRGRNIEWLNLIVDFPGDLLRVAYTLRRFPPSLHWLIAPCLPATYRLSKRYKEAFDFLIPLIKQCSKENNVDKSAGRARIPDGGTVLSWMMKHGDIDETKEEEMAARQVLLTLASIHTTSMTVTNVLYDLCEHQEWISILRQEISNVTQHFGTLRLDSTSCKPLQWLKKLEKMDSFIIETLRLRPVLLLSPQREVMETFVFKDGLRIAKGTRVSWAAWEHINSPEITPNPDIFDPMRSYQKSQKSQDEKKRHTGFQTDINNLTFGYGKLACPGRSFAIAEAKIILVKLLSEFDFRFRDSECRPKDMFTDEQMFPDPTARLMVRKRNFDQLSVNNVSSFNVTV